MENDLTTFYALPAHPVAPRAFALMCELFSALGKDVEIDTELSAIAPDQFFARWADMAATWKRNSG